MNVAAPIPFRTSLKRYVFVAIIIVVMLCTARAGTITGTVTARGKPEAEGPVAVGKYDSRKFKFVEKVDYAALRDFVVFIDGKLTNRVAPTNRLQTVLTQKDATFRPHVLPIVAGTTVQWPNEDDIYHNVFSVSEPRPFDLGLYKKDAPDKIVPFDQPGRVDVFCSIHSHMHCIVLVLENPYFAATDAKNRYVIRNVPAGTYKLKAWHERLPALVQEITVPETGEVKVDFTLGINNLPKF
jgi:plastocyanin